MSSMVNRMETIVSKLELVENKCSVGSWVLAYTEDRTRDVDEMTDREYWSLIENLEDMRQYMEVQRQYRASVYRVMEQYGVPTHDRAKTNAWLLEVSGKKLPNLSVDELYYLKGKIRKLIAQGKRYGRSNG